MIGILDYGVGNLGSILNMLIRAGADAQLVSNAESLYGASKLILPGVGHFDTAMRRLNASGMREALETRVVRDGIPVLGICVGMQMFARGSDEGSEYGLGFIDAHCKRFGVASGESVKVPLMGWNTVEVKAASPLTANLGPRPRFYFVHSYYVSPAEASVVVATSRHGVEYASIIRARNIMGVQFHPEKSHRFGMTILRNFAEM